MTIQLNRVNVDIRENLRSEVKDDIVSTKIQLDVDNKMKKPFLEDREEKEKKKKFFTTTGIKHNNNIEVNAEINQEEFTNNSIGIFIDKIK